MGISLPRANLIVIRSGDIDRAVKFYEVIGLKFERHRHGAGPEHLASECAGLVFEIYPDRNGSNSTTATRLGFEVEAVDALVLRLREIGAAVLTEPSDSPWGRRAVVRDMDGHAVELTAKP